MKKLLAVMLCLAMLFSMTAVVATAEGGATEVVKIGIQGDPEVLSPTGVNKYEKPMEYEIYDHLFEKSKGEGDYDIIPRIGKSYTVSDDGLSVKVEIFDYVTDSAGNKITAYDCAFCYNNAKAVKERNMGLFVSAEATSDTEFTMTLSRPFALGEEVALMTSFNMFNQAAWEADGTNFATKPIASGPYVVESFTPGYSCVLKAREDYWQTDEQYLSIYQQANVPTIEYYFINESTQIAIALQTGTIDWSCAVNYADMPNFREGGANADDFDVITHTENLCFTLLPNVSENSPMSDLRVRKAVMMTIDNTMISAALSGGEALPLKAIGHGNASDYNTAWDTQDTIYNTYDVEAAKALLTEAGYPNGFDAVLYGRSEESYQNIAAILQGLLSQIGINLEIKLYDETTLNDYQTNPENWDLLMCTWPSGDYVMKMYNFMYNDENWSYGTENFIQDDKLQELFDAAWSAETHNAETVDALFQYVTEQVYGYCMVAETYNEVYRNTVFAEAPTWNAEHIWIMAGSCQYK